jgi:Holliday junction resolvase RusA-like endonuclease
MLHFVVYGVAVPKGSTKSFGFVLRDKVTGRELRDRNGRPLVRTVTSNDNPKTKSWQQLVAEGANAALGQLLSDDRALLLDGVRVTCAFWLPRPKGLPKKRTAHLTAPDIDKLLRSIFDGLSGTVWRDDSQVVEVIAMKRYAALDDTPHVELWIEPTQGLAAVPQTAPLFEGIA